MTKENLKICNLKMVRKGNNTEGLKNISDTFI